MFEMPHSWISSLRLMGPAHAAPGDRRRRHRPSPPRPPKPRPHTRPRRARPGAAGPVQNAGHARAGIVGDVRHRDKALELVRRPKAVRPGSLLSRAHGQWACPLGGNAGRRGPIAPPADACASSCRAVQRLGSTTSNSLRTSSGRSFGRNFRSKSIMATSGVMAGLLETRGRPSGPMPAPAIITPGSIVLTPAGSRGWAGFRVPRSSLISANGLDQASGNLDGVDARVRRSGLSC